MTRIEVARMLDIGTETLRYYERVFPDLAPDRDTNNYRVYSPEHLNKLRFILKAKQYGFSLSEINGFINLIERKKVDASDIVQEIEKKLEDVERSIAYYTQQKEWLERLKNSSHLGRCESFSALAPK